MNESGLMKRLVLLSLLALCACSQPAAEAPPLDGARIGGPFTLVDQDGRQATDKQFQGKYRLMYFGFTYCPDVCPVDLQLIAQGLRALEKDDPAKAEKIQPIFVTVDPERDTPEVMKKYVAAFHPRLIGLTGTPEQIAAAKKTFGVYGEKRVQEGSTDYLVDHSRIAMLFGPDGKPIAIIPHDRGVEGVEAELERWVA